MIQTMRCLIPDRSQSVSLPVVEEMRDGLWLWNIEKDTIQCNDQWYQQLGYAPQEFPVSSESFHQLLHPDDTKRMDQALRSYAFGNAPLYSERFQLRRKDGTYEWIWARGNLVEWNPAGDPIRVTGIHSLSANPCNPSGMSKNDHCHYKHLFESMQSGFALHEIVCDERGIPCDYRFLEVNEAFEQLIGLKAENLIGRTVKDVLPMTEPHWIDTYGQVALTGKPVRIEHYSRLLDRFYSVTIYSPGAHQFATVFFDITEQKNAQEAVRQAYETARKASQAKTQLLTNMNHELRTPLNAILGLTDLLKDTPLDEEQLDCIHTIESSGESLLSLISNLFDFSTIESGKMKIQNENFSLRDLINKISMTFAQLAANRKIELIVDVDASIPEPIHGDSKRLQQVLESLMHNAFKFTNQGFVRLSVNRKTIPSGGYRIEFTVADSGTGMDSETTARMFKSFEQGDGSSTREHGGTGLGLTLAKRLIELMGGSLRVESIPGKGSTFSFHVSDQVQSQNKPSSNDVRNRWQGTCMGVWGDDPSDMRRAEALLEYGGIVPHYADSIDGIRYGIKNDLPPDLVLCNVDMPDIRKHITELRRLQPVVPWIAFSSWDSPLDEQVKACFSAFIDRPLQDHQLYAALNLLLDANA